jgi:putative membrane protein
MINFYAHITEVPIEETLKYRWEWDPLILSGLALMLMLYTLGLISLRRPDGHIRYVKTWECLCFYLGLATLFLALVSPLHTLGQYYFSIHMTQHEVLMLIASPLLVLGRPLVVFLWAFNLNSRRRIGSLIGVPFIKYIWEFITAPFAAWGIQALALWIWHIPFLFEAVLHSNLIHSLQHLSFILSSSLFWWAIIQNDTKKRHNGAGVLYLFTTSLHSGTLGALLTLARKSWYPSYILSSLKLGYDPLEDQILGGLIMWIPAGMVYFFAALILFIQWLKSSEKKRTAFAFSFIFLLIVSLYSKTIYAEDTSLVFISCERGGIVSVIDPVRDEVIDNIQTGARPRGVRVSPDGRSLFVAVSSPLGGQKNSNLDEVAVFDVQTRKKIKDLKVGLDPEQLAISKDGKRIYVSNEDAGTASVVDVLSGELLKKLVVGIEPEGAVISPDDKKVYITAETSSSVSVIDTSSDEIAASFMVGARPRDAVFSPDGKTAYVSAENGKSLSIVDTESSTVTNTIFLGENTKPAGLVMTNDGKKLYVATGRGNTVIVFDPIHLKIINEIAVGERNWGLSLLPDNKKLYVANGLSNDVSVIDTSTNNVIKTIKVADGPWGVAVSK